MFNRKAHSVCIDPGHGGDDRGVIAHDVEEADIVLRVCNNLRAHLEQARINTTQTRILDDDPGWEARKRLGNQCSLVLSVHVDSGIQPQWRGLHVLHWPGNLQGQAIAKHISRYAPTALKRSRYVYSADHLWPRARNVIAAYKPTALVVELGYLTREEDAAYLSSSRGIHAAASSLAASITDLF